MAVIDNPVYCLFVVQIPISQYRAKSFPIPLGMIPMAISSLCSALESMIPLMASFNAPSPPTTTMVRITIVGQNSGKSFYRAETFGLHIVVCHTLLSPCTLLFLSIVFAPSVSRLWDCRLPPIFQVLRSLLLYVIF